MLLKDENEFERRVDILYNELNVSTPCLFVHYKNEERDIVLDTKRGDDGFKKKDVLNVPIYYTFGKLEDLEEEIIHFEPSEYFIAIRHSHKKRDQIKTKYEDSFVTGKITAADIRKHNEKKD